MTKKAVQKTPVIQLVNDLFIPSRVIIVLHFIEILAKKSEQKYFQAKRLIKASNTVFFFIL